VTDSIVKFDSKPVLERPVLIEALPGIGNVGKIAGDFLAESLKAKRFARIYSMNFPAQVTPDKDCVVKMASNELWYAKLPDGRDAVFLRGGCQASTPEGQFIVAQNVIDIMLSYGMSQVVTLGGYGTGLMADNPHVYGAVTRAELKPALEKAGVTFNPGQPQAGIIGAAGLLLGFAQMNGIDGYCLMGETSGYFEDHKSALAVVEVLLKLFGIKGAKKKRLQEQAKKIDELSAQVKAAGEQEPGPNDLGYIG
jgi:uncharacterized protein (TIGR00162 family)